MFRFAMSSPLTTLPLADHRDFLSFFVFRPSFLRFPCHSGGEIQLHRWLEHARNVCISTNSKPNSHIIIPMRHMSLAIFFLRVYFSVRLYLQFISTNKGGYLFASIVTWYIGCKRIFRLSRPLPLACFPSVLWPPRVLSFRSFVRYLFWIHRDGVYFGVFLYK